MRSISLKKEEYIASDMISEFLMLQQQKGVTENTLRLHKHSLVALHRGCTGVPDEIQLRKCLPPSMGNAYYNKRLSSYRQFFKMLKDFGQTQIDPTENFHYRKTTFNLKNYDECKVIKFLQAIDTTTFAGLRDYTMCLFIIDTGVRPSEIVQIKKDDISNGTVSLSGKITKTRTPRTVPISNYIMQKVRYLHSYEMEEWHNEYVFCTSEGKQLTTMALRHNLHKVALKCGITYTPYDFRHIFATTYIRNGGDAFTLQRILGHTKTNMTMTYVNLTATDLSVSHNRVNVLGNFVSNRLSKLNKP